MARRRDASLTVALCLSLVAHGGVGLALLEGQASESRRRIAQPSLDRSALAVGPILVPELPERKAEPPVKPPAAEKLPAVPEEKHELAPLPVKKPEPAFLKSVFGEADGQGDAENASPGEELMRARRSAPENQAFLSKDPIGGGRVGDPPSMSTASPGEGGQGKPGPIRKAAEAVPSVPAPPKASLLAMSRQQASPPPAPVGTVQPKRERPPVVNEKPEPEKPFGVPSERVEAVAPKKARKAPEGPAVVAIANPSGVKPVEGSELARDVEDVTGREAKAAVQAPPPPKPSGAPRVEEASERAALIPPVVQASAPARPEVARQAESGGRPGKATPAADPAPMSDSEADAFGKVVNVEFRNGRVEAQTGRRIKTVRPKLLLSAKYEMFTHENPRVLLSANVDETGHVTKVEIYQSSGTPDLDQPCLVAVYDWWFEPPKGKDGKPKADVVVVAITFRTS